MKCLGPISLWARLLLVTLQCHNPNSTTTPQSICRYRNSKILTSSLEYPERIRVVSVFETWLCLFFVCQSANFLIFIQYSTEECSTVQLLANSLEYPQRIEIEWSQCLNSVFVCLFFACQSANFLIFIQYSTEECSTVQLFFYKIIAVMIDIDSS